MQPFIDLNCDLGEGAGQDDALMPLITSANIACGGHAGDETAMREAVRLACQHGVAIGAHPGYEDKTNFGRIEVPLTAEAVHALVLRQVERLRKITDAMGARLTHVKPHGALYNVAARDEQTAGAIVAAVKDAGADLVLFALSGSVLATMAKAAGLCVASEVFADRAYRADGSLVPRSQAGAVHAEDAVMLAQVLDLVLQGSVETAEGRAVKVQADTLCLHGDGEHAVPFAKQIRAMLAQAGVAVRPFARRAT